MSTILVFIKDFMPIVCGIIGVYLAWSGLNTWKKQLRSSSGHDLAKRMLHTVAVSSSLIKPLNYGLNLIVFFMDFNSPPEKTVDMLDKKNLEKLIILQPDMEIIKEEALATLGDKANSYKELYTYIEQYIAVVRIFILMLQNEDMRKTMKVSLLQSISSHVPLVTKEEYFSLSASGNIPIFHDSHKDLINKVKSDITPYLQYSQN